MRREFSAGGIVLRRLEGVWHLATIRPGGKGAVWALPKGIVRPSERPEEAAAREVTEETGVDGELVQKLGDVRYAYTWEGERVFKIVSFYLFRYRSGELGAILPEHAHEVAEARWLPLEDAPEMLTYRGEQDMARKAIERLHEGPGPAL